MVVFESHIIDSVFDKLKGEYTKEQIRDVFRASISYANNLCTYSENNIVCIPYVGKIVCNIREMKHRKNNLSNLKDKVEHLSEYQEKELNVLDVKIKDIEDELEVKDIKRGNMLIKHNKLSIFRARKGRSFKEIQKIQEKEFDKNF